MIRLTVGTGEDKGQGDEHQMPDLHALIDFVNGLRGIEAWWSGGTFEHGSRSSDRWTGSALCIVDVDGPKEQGRKVPLPREAWDALVRSWQAGKFPGHWVHATPHGLRVVALLDQFVEDATVWTEAVRSFAQIVDDALLANRLLAPFRLRVDGGPTKDRARLYWVPHCQLNGTERSGRYVSNAERAPYRVNVITQPRTGSGYIAGKRPKTVPQNDWQKARARFIESHPLPGIGKDRECPACSHKGCANVLPHLPDRLWCWSTNHGECGRPVCDPETGEVRGHMLDALDLAAYRDGKTATQVLVDAGLLDASLTRETSVLVPGVHPLPNGEYRHQTEHVFVHEALDLIPDKTVFTYGGSLVYPDGGSPRAFTVNGMRLLASEYVTLKEWRKPRGKNAEPVQVTRSWSPDHAGLAYTQAAELGHEHVRSIRGVIDSPMPYLNGGDLEFCQVGWNPCGFYRTANHRLDGVEPTEDVNEILRVLRAPIAGFPFAPYPERGEDGEEASGGNVAAASEANALAFYFTLYALPLITGTRPLLVTTAPTQGTGKTLLLMTIAAGITGTLPLVRSLSNDGEKMADLITSILRNPTRRAAVIDNVRSVEPVGDTALEALLTSPEWSDRGKYEATASVLPNNLGWGLTLQSGTTLGADLASRSYGVYLDAALERPHERRFDSDPVAAAQEAHAEIVSACMGAVRLWDRAGRPRPGPDVPRSRHGAWRDVVGGILGVLGVEGFLANSDAFMQHAHRDDDPLDLLVHVWLGWNGGARCSGADLIRVLTSADVHIGPAGETARSLGTWLRTCENQIRRGHMYRRGMHAGQTTHRLVKMRGERTR